MRLRLVAAVAVVVALAWGIVYAAHSVARRAQSFASQLERASLPWFEVGRETRSFDAEGVRALSIKSGMGTIEVTPGGPGVEVEVMKKAQGRDLAEARARARDMKVTYSDDRTGRLSIVGESGGGGLNTMLDLVIRAPAEMSVAIDAGAGELVVRGMEGAVTVAADAGEIVVERATGPVDVKARAGEIRLRDLRSDRVRARVDAGEVDVHFAEPFWGELRARARIGEVTVALAPGSRCRVQTNVTLGSISDGLPARVVSRTGPGVIEAGVGIGEVTLVEAD